MKHEQAAYVTFRWKTLHELCLLFTLPQCPLTFQIVALCRLGPTVGAMGRAPFPTPIKMYMLHKPCINLCSFKPLSFGVVLIINHGSPEKQSGGVVFIMGIGSYGYGSWVVPPVCCLWAGELGEPVVWFSPSLKAWEMGWGIGRVGVLG